MAENQIVKEIMQKFDSDEYTEYVRHLSNRDVVSLYHFNISDMGRYYWIDIRHCFTVEQLNPNHVLEYFSLFSSLDPVSLCSMVIIKIPKERPYWTHAGAVVCQMNFITFEEWEHMMQKDNCMCDELMIFMLSRMHYCHTMIYTANRVWCTIHNIDGMDNSEIHSKCDLHLVYLGNNTYGELKRKPMTPTLPSSLQALPIINMQKE